MFMPKNYKDMIDEIINKSPMEEDAPANAVGDGSNVSLPPSVEPGVKKKKKDEDEVRDPLMFAKPLKRRIKENNDNNNVVLKSILDGLDKVDNFIDKMNGIETEVEIKNIEEKKSFKKRYNIK